LEAKRFTTTRRQHGEDILARERVADDLLLQWPERREAEILL
jgi:hypothetical protein